MGTHLCFMNLNYYLEVNPGSYKLDHTITRDDTSMLELHLNFKEGPYTLRMNAPYLVPLYKYLTTPTSIFSTFFIPLPMMTAPFEVTLDVDTVERTLRFASNVDHYKPAWRSPPRRAPSTRWCTSAGSAPRTATAASTSSPWPGTRSGTVSTRRGGTSRATPSSTSPRPASARPSTSSSTRTPSPSLGILGTVTWDST